VRWSIRHSCALRPADSAAVPAHTERLLRGVHAAGAALAEGRILEGIAVAPTSAWSVPDDGRGSGRAVPTGDAAPTDSEDVLGFRLADVTAIFGGADEIERHCACCEVNVDRAAREKPWAGCFGMLVRDDHTGSWTQQWQRAHESIANRFDLEVLVAKTNPAWYGWWMEPMIAGEKLAALEALVNRLPESTTGRTHVRRFAVALRLAREAGAAVDVFFYPPGVADERRWTIRTHCHRCRAPQGPDEPHCAICGRRGRCHGMVYRKPLGRRPWMPLIELVGPDRARNIVSQGVAARRSAV
jgi:hypothetical protein